MVLIQICTIVYAEAQESSYLIKSQSRMSNTIGKPY